jgi:hypothetical protein
MAWLKDYQYMFYKEIGGEVRHLWFGLSTDGMNPFD